MAPLGWKLTFIETVDLIEAEIAKPDSDIGNIEKGLNYLMSFLNPADKGMSVLQRILDVFGSNGSGNTP